MKKNPVFLFFALISLIFLIALTGCHLNDSNEQGAPSVEAVDSDILAPTPTLSFQNSNEDEGSWLDKKLKELHVKDVEAPFRERSIDEITTEKSEEIKNDVKERLETEDAVSTPLPEQTFSPNSYDGFHGIPWRSSRQLVCEILRDDWFINKYREFTFVSYRDGATYESYFTFDEDDLLIIGVDHIFGDISNQDEILTEALESAIDVYGIPVYEPDGAFWPETPNGYVIFIEEPTPRHQTDDSYLLGGFIFYAPGAYEDFIASMESDPTPQLVTYILNTNTKKFHYPRCSSVDQIKESNKQEYTGTREDVIARGYEPCGRCDP